MAFDGLVETKLAELPYKELVSAVNLLRSYQLTRRVFNIKFMSQGKVCAICGTSNWRKRNPKPYVDHDHSTGQIRGLLCCKCNTLLGMANDNIEILEMAIAYIDKWNKFFADTNIDEAYNYD